MVSIPEERGELAMEIAQDVIQGLDIERKLDERMHEVFHRGDWFLQEMKVQQEQSTHALHRSVKMCLESQRLFHEEHQSLLNAVKQLEALVVSYSPYSIQAAEANSMPVAATAAV